MQIYFQKHCLQLLCVKVNDDFANCKSKQCNCELEITVSNSAELQLQHASAVGANATLIELLRIEVLVGDKRLCYMVLSVIARKCVLWFLVGRRYGVTV